MAEPIAFATCSSDGAATSPRPGPGTWGRRGRSVLHGVPHPPPLRRRCFPGLQGQGARRRLRPGLERLHVRTVLGGPAMFVPMGIIQLWDVDLAIDETKPSPGPGVRALCIPQVSVLGLPS